MSFLFAQSGLLAAQQIVWQDLKDPNITAYDDPFASLSTHELIGLSAVIRLQNRLKEQGLTPEQRLTLEKRLKNEKALLGAIGVEVDALLSQRERVQAALAGNRDLEGKEVSITGYAIPVEIEGEALSNTGYLVPLAGMCSHMPAPDPNQMIRYNVSADQQAAEVYAPVQLVGTLSLQLTRQEIMLLDGQVEMLAAFQMKVQKVSVWEQGERFDPASRVWNHFMGGSTLPSWKRQ